MKEEIDTFYSTFPKEEYGIYQFSVGIKKNHEMITYGNIDVPYDIASITKLFTLNLLYLLEKEGKIHYHDLISLYLDVPNLMDVKILDLIQMKDTLRTNGKLSDALSKEDFIEKLLHTEVVAKDTPEYSDIGFCLLGLLIEKVTGLSLADNFTSLFSNLGLQHTVVNPKEKVLGNGNQEQLPHDFKTRIMGVTGAAGIFSTVSDLLLYGKYLLEYQVFDESFLSDIFQYHFLDTKNRRRSYAGLYQYTKEYRCYVDKRFSDYTLAHQGFTGAVFVCDLKNKNINVLLFDAIENGSSVKQDNFFDGYYQLQDKTAEFTVGKVAR